MPKIISTSTVTPPYKIQQIETVQMVKELFEDSFDNIDRLLKVFENGQINTRYFCAPLDWFRQNHSLKERNDLYLFYAVKLGVEAIKKCLTASTLIEEHVAFEDIDAIIFVSSTGFATPSIEARIMNRLPFSAHTKRIPLWGLGCAGGASGLSRAYDYCLGHPEAKVLILSVELCSLTFQKDDYSKSNLVGTSLFGDGVACALMTGDSVNYQDLTTLRTVPNIIGTQSTLFPNTEEVMGWDVRDNGLYVIFSKDIPTIIKRFLLPNIEQFVSHYDMELNEIDVIIAHPGGKKVIEAYEESLSLESGKTSISKQVLQNYGNMSSATIFYVLHEFIKLKHEPNTVGLFTALGPGFSSELLLAKWE